MSGVVFLVKPYFTYGLLPVITVELMEFPHYIEFSATKQVFAQLSPAIGIRRSDQLRNRDS